MEITNNEEINIKEEQSKNYNRVIFDPSNSIFCNICERDITTLTKIFCEECDLFTCIRCLANGVEKFKHKKTHRYKVIDNMQYCLYEKGWKANEELLLLEGLYKRGFGNWSDIADMVQTKSKEECEIHYMKFWYNKIEFDDVEVLVKNDKNGKIVPLKKGKGTPNRSKKSNATLVEEKLEKYKEMVEEKKKEMKLVDPGFNDILGYLPLREDFDVEYDNEAELFLAEMEFNDSDTEKEMNLKKKILEIYNKRLDERIKRKKFVMERGLLDLRKQNMLDRNRSKDEKEIYNMLKVFARFHSEDEHDQLVQSIVQEKEIRRRIEELKTYKKLGCKTFEDVEKYVREKREKDENYIRQGKVNQSKLMKDNNHPVKSSKKRQNRGLREKANKSKREISNSKMSLSQQEVKLCEELDMSFHDYLLVKEILVRESVAQGFISRSWVENSLKIEKDKLIGIFDFLVANDLVLKK